MTDRIARIIGAGLLIVAGVAGCRGPAEGEAPPASDAAPSPPPAAAGAKAQPEWTVTEDVQTPESAFVDTMANSIFVSLINGDPAARDGNGHIAQLSRDGEVAKTNWAVGLNAPKGMRSAGKTLWVADLDEVVGIEIPSGKITARVKIPGAQFLNDVATSPDGAIYVSDTNARKIFVIRDGKPSVFAEGDTVEVPNGLLVDRNRLIVGAFRQSAAQDAPPGHLFALDLATKQKTLLSPDPVGNIDGVESDGRGGYIVSDVFAGKILHVSDVGRVRVLKEVEGTAADIGYDPERKMLVVPHLRENKVSGYSLSDVLQ